MKGLFGPNAPAALHHLKDDVDHAANFLADLVGVYTQLLCCFNHLPNSSTAVAGSSLIACRRCSAIHSSRKWLPRSLIQEYMFDARI